MVCRPHTLCAAGQWTKATGTTSTDTACVDCAIGTWRKTGPTSTVAEREADVCVRDKRGDNGCKWGRSSRNAKCKQGAGEVPLRKSSVRTSSLEKCKESCENAPGCQSVTYFKTGFCAHFSTSCTNIKKSRKAVVERLETACTETPSAGTATLTYARDFQLCKGCSADAVPCLDWPSQSARESFKSESGQCGSHLCCQIKNACDVCNGEKDKPQQLRLRWVGNGGAPSSIAFSSEDICVQETTLTSDSDSNEVVLDAASCFGSGSKLPTNIYFEVDGSSISFHASCSQPLNVGDVLYTDKNKGFLVLVGFRAMSGRTDGACSGARPQSNSDCDICNGKNDKPRKIRLRWKGNTGVPSSITFSSRSTCVEEIALTSDSNSNEVLLDAASCFGSGSTLPSNIYFKVDGSAKYLHTSCSQALNVGDVIHMDTSKGSLVLAGFETVSGRTERACIGSAASAQDQCTCDDAKECFGDVLRQMRKKNYRLECEPVKPQICEAVTRVHISPEDCSTTAQGCSHANGFKIVMCPCAGQCFDGKTCQATKCPCNSIDCSDWSPQKASFLDYINMDRCLCTGRAPCLTDYTLPKCDVCNLRKDKPQTLIFRWVGKTGAQSSINFQSDGICVKQTTLTSGSKSNEVVIDASCFDSGSKLPTNIYFKVDGATAYLHASCSQPLNVGDVVYKHPSKGSLVLVGFRSVSGRTETDCPSATHTCKPRSATAPSLSCSAGIKLTKGKSTKGVNVRVNPDSSVQYMWSQTRHTTSSSWTDQFEYTALSCDGEEVKGKVVINVETPWANTRQGTATSIDKRVWGNVRYGVECDMRAGEVMIKSSWKKASSIDHCKEFCQDATGCQSITFVNDGWCSLFTTPCTKTSKNKNTVVAVLAKAPKSNCREVLLKRSSRKVSTADECNKSCMGAPECKYTKFYQRGWCAHFGTSCTEAWKLNSNSSVVALALDIERDPDLAILRGVGDIWWILMIAYLFCVFLF